MKEQQKKLIIDIMNDDAKDGLYKQQSAVEWLIDQMFRQGYFDGNKPLSITNLDHLQHQAKEMEKEQIVESFKHGEMPKLFSNLSAEQYYNEKYGKL